MTRSTEKLRKAVMVSAFGAAFASCSAMSGRETARQDAEDGKITMRIKSAYFADPSLKAYEINLETFQNVVQLSGFVDKPEDASRAVEIASRVEGVRSAHNDIIVRNANTSGSGNLGG